MNFKKNISSAQGGFPLAPMIDIMFLLLIFFMVATIYAQFETKLGITVPTASSGASGARERGEIIINLDAEGRIFINDAEMNTSRLEGLLGQVAQEFRDQPVIIRADAQTRHEKVVSVLDICRKVDIWNVAFATLEPKGE
jgi:biopolymer transport protein ExbD